MCFGVDASDIDNHNRDTAHNHNSLNSLAAVVDNTRNCTVVADTAVAEAGADSHSVAGVDQDKDRQEDIAPADMLIVAADMKDKLAFAVPAANRDIVAVGDTTMVQVESSRNLAGE